MKEIIKVIVDNNPWQDLNSEEATKLLIEWLKDNSYGMQPSYGYDVYLPSLAFKYLESRSILSSQRQIFQKHSYLFYNAAWELCRRGILRPGVKSYQGQSTEDGAAGNGYSITPFGQTWLNETEHHDFVPTEPESFGRLIEPYKEQFGNGFHQRAQEAIRCYGAHAYLSSCVMCGAAAESIMLNLAIAKSGDEEQTLKTYRAAKGRSSIEKTILHNKSSTIKENFSTINSLLKYWRDESAHGMTTKIKEDEAFTALALLLRVCKISSRYYTELTTKD